MTVVRRKRTGELRDRYIEETLALIAEKGGSMDVNLREVSRRIGCAHTNAYNYFEDFDDLLWEAYREGLRVYGDWIAEGLTDDLSGREYFDRMMRNLFEFGLENPGLHRFLSSDPFSPDDVPGDIIDCVVDMKAWFNRSVLVLCLGRVTKEEADSIGDILLSYMDGELFNLINGRVLPNEEAEERVLGNLDTLFTLLTSRTNEGIVLERDATGRGELTYPMLEVCFGPVDERREHR